MIIVSFYLVIIYLWELGKRWNTMQSSFPSFYYYILRQEIYIHLGLYSIHSGI